MVKVGIYASNVTFKNYLGSGMSMKYCTYNIVF